MRSHLEEYNAALMPVAVESNAHLQESVELDKRLDVADQHRAQAKSPAARAAAQAELDAVTVDKKHWNAKRVELLRRLDAALARLPPPSARRK